MRHISNQDLLDELKRRVSEGLMSAVLIDPQEVDRELFSGSVERATDDSVIIWDDLERSVESCLTLQPAWVPIVVECLNDIKDTAERHGHHLPVVTEIKQKLGSLRIYVGGGASGYAISMIAQAEAECANACENCGNSAAIQDVHGYLTCRCAWCVLPEVERVTRGKSAGPINSRIEEEHQHLMCTKCGYFGQISRHWGEKWCAYCADSAELTVAVFCEILEDNKSCEFTISYGFDFALRSAKFTTPKYPRADETLALAAKAVKKANEDL